MRIAAQAKLGFYPIHPTVVDAICSHLEPPQARTDPETGELISPPEFSILDPCAGEGLAIRRIALNLGVPEHRVFGVELDAGRGEKVRENLPQARVLAPASFLATQINVKSFGLVYANPPFDDELGGGRREEHTFAIEATRLLKPGGILVLVMPLTAIGKNDKFKEYLDAQYEDEMLYVFPDDPEIRRFREVVYIGRRRREPLPSGEVGLLRKGGLKEVVIGSDDRAWRIPGSKSPNTFKKVDFTDEELFASIDRSPLQRLLAVNESRRKLRPPLSLSGGHVALQLASGRCNGAVYPDDEPPHVVRGSSRKAEVRQKPKVTKDPETGVTTVKTVVSEAIRLDVRTIDSAGRIQTFVDAPATTPGAEVVDVSDLEPELEEEDD